MGDELIQGHGFHGDLFTDHDGLGLVCFYLALLLYFDGSRSFFFPFLLFLLELLFDGSILFGRKKFVEVIGSLFQ